MLPRLDKEGNKQLNAEKRFSEVRKKPSRLQIRKGKKGLRTKGWRKVESDIRNTID